MLEKTKKQQAVIVANIVQRMVHTENGLNGQLVAALAVKELKQDQENALHQNMEGDNATVLLLNLNHVN